MLLKGGEELPVTPKNKMGSSTLSPAQQGRAVAYSLSGGGGLIERGHQSLNSWFF